jgi:hypothetical protein
VLRGRAEPSRTARPGGDNERALDALEPARNTTAALERLGLERRHQLIPDNLLGSLTDVLELRRHDDSRPRRHRPEKGGVAQEEDAELIKPGIGDDVDDHAAASGMDADAPAVWEEPHSASVTLDDRNVKRFPGSIRISVVSDIDFMWCSAG